MTTKDDDLRAGLIGHVASPLVESEPRPNIDGDKIYEDARALCYGLAKDVAKPFERHQLSDFTVCERQIIDCIAEWMGSRDCQIQKLQRISEQLVIEATSATNALACLARAQYQHAEVARLHIAINLLKEKLVGYHADPPLSAEPRPRKIGVPVSQRVKNSKSGPLSPEVPGDLLNRARGGLSTELDILQAHWRTISDSTKETADHVFDGMRVDELDASECYTRIGALTVAVARATIRAMVGYHGTQPLSEASPSAQSEAPKRRPSQETR